MRQQFTKIITRFEPATEFDVAARGAQETDLDQLKERLLATYLKNPDEGAEGTPLRLAANEAAGLAWFTPFPLLFLPVLLEEKVAEARTLEFRQRRIREQTEALLEIAIAE